MAVAKKLWLFAAVAAAILAAAVPEFPIAARADAVVSKPSDPVSVVEAFHSALHRGDPATAADLLDDKAIIYEEGEAELTKAEYASNHLTADAAFSPNVDERVLRRDKDVFGDIAWVATLGRVTGRFEGRDIDRFTTETVILRHSDGRWKIVHIHWSSRPAKNDR